MYFPLNLYAWWIPETRKYLRLNGCFDGTSVVVREIPEQLGPVGRTLRLHRPSNFAVRELSARVQKNPLRVLCPSTHVSPEAGRPRLETW